MHRGSGPLDFVNGEYDGTVKLSKTLPKQTLQYLPLDKSTIRPLDQLKSLIRCQLL